MGISLFHCAYAITGTPEVTTPVTHMYMPRKICRESTETQGKPTNTSKSTDWGARSAPQALPKAGLC